MSERADKSMRTLKQAIDTATGGSISDEDIIAILKGERLLDHPVAVVLAETGILAQASGIEFNTIHHTYLAALEIAGAAMPEELADHPEVVRRKVGPVWPPDKPFPLTPLEAWYVMRGWEVAPAAGVTMQQILEELPGKLEGGDGWIQLWQP